MAKAIPPNLVNKFTGKKLKLGRRPPRAEVLAKLIPLTPFLRRAGATPPPATVDYSSPAAKALATMLGNDQQGDCTIAAVLHQLGVSSAVQPGGTPLVPTTAEALSQYTAICGPGDNGCVITDVLDAWQTKGLTAAGKTVVADGYVALQLADQLQAQLCTYLLGALHLGINLPSAWYTNAAPGAVWDVTDDDIIGGHSVAVVGYGPQGLTISTWGMVLTMTWAAYMSSLYVEESYAVLADDWEGAVGLDTHGFDVAALQAALAAVKAGQEPVIPSPAPTPPTPPAPTPAGDWPVYTGTLLGIPGTLTLTPQASSSAAPDLRAMLRARGVSTPLSDAIEQLVADIQAGAGASAYMGDVVAILAALFANGYSAQK